MLLKTSTFMLVSREWNFHLSSKLATEAPTILASSPGVDLPLYLGADCRKKAPERSATPAWDRASAAQAGDAEKCWQPAPPAAGSWAERDPVPLLPSPRLRTGGGEEAAGCTCTATDAVGFLQ